MAHIREDLFKQTTGNHSIDRRHFLKLMAMAGLLVTANTRRVNAFSSKAKGKIVIIGGGAAGLGLTHPTLPSSIPVTASFTNPDSP